MRGLIKFEPLRDLLDFKDSLFDDLWSMGRSSFKELTFTPKIEVLDREDAITVKAEIPGVSKKDIKLSIKNNNLVIQGEQKKETETKEKGYYYSERSYGNFYRSIAIPGEIDEKKVKAKYEDGILTITLPKTKESQEKSRLIEIE